MAEHWRVLPWDSRVRPGRPFSPSFVPGATGRGRFDLPVDRSPVLYLAESPEHAVAEALQPWRNRPLRTEHLERAGLPLAVVRVRLSDDARPGVADLCDPEVLGALDVGADQIASRHRHVTQPIARLVWEAGHSGLRWWSTFWGDWHGVILFTERIAAGLILDEPEALSLETPAVRVAARALGMTLPTGAE